LWFYDIDDLLNYARFLVFQVRDLERAQALLRGEPILFGPETTGGGNLPGPFYYVILAFGWLLTHDWIGPYYTLIVLSAVAVTIGWLYFRKYIGVESAFLWMGLFVLSAPLQNFIGVFLNVSYQPLFCVIALIGIVKAFTSEQPRTQRLSLIVVAISIALCIQLHYSSLSLAFAVIGLQWLAPKLGIKRIPNSIFAQATLAFFVPLLPYFLWLIFRERGMEVGQTTILAGQTRSALPTMLSFIEWPDWPTIKGCLHFFQNSMPLALPFFALAIGIEKLSSGRNTVRQPLSPVIKIILVCCAFTIIPALYVFVAPIGIRYGLSFSIATIFLTTLLLTSELPPERHRVFWILSAIGAVGLVATSIFNNGYRDFIVTTAVRHVPTALFAIGAIVFFTRANKRPNVLYSIVAAMVLAWVQNPSLWGGDLARHEMLIPSRIGWGKTLKTICIETGWSGQRIFDSVYFIHGHMELDPRPVLRAMEGKCTRVPTKPDVSGYFITFEHLYGDLPFKEWLLDQPIDSDIKTGIRSGAIELGPTVTGNYNIALTPYIVKNLERFPASFHNIGVGYAESKWQQLLKTEALRPGGKKLADGRLLLSINDCQDGHPYCLAGAVIDVNQDKATTRLSVNLIGDSLSQSSPWIRPTWTVAWREPYIEAACGPKVQKFVLASSVGYNREFGNFSGTYNFYLSNHSLLTPFRRELTVDCKVTKVTLGRKSGVLDLIQNTVELPTAQVSIDL
jgi:hypothetical protein